MWVVIYELFRCFEAKGQQKEEWQQNLLRGSRKRGRVKQEGKAKRKKRYRECYTVIFDVLECCDGCYVSQSYPGVHPYHVVGW
jgi:hypothetical protein